MIFQARKKKELLRLLEVANINLGEARDHVPHIFEPKTADYYSNRLYRVQDEIRRLKQLVKI